MQVTIENDESPADRPGPGERWLARMRRAREAVMWLGMIWLVAFIVLGVVGLFGGAESAAADPDSWGPGGRPPVDVQLSDGGQPLGQNFNPDRWTGGLTSRVPFLGDVLQALALATLVLVGWLAWAVFACARAFGGTVYALGHASLLLLGTPLFVGPAWIPLLVEDDIRRGHASRVRRLPNPTRGDLLVLAAGAIFVALLLGVLD